LNRKNRKASVLALASQGWAETFSLYDYCPHPSNQTRNEAHFTHSAKSVNARDFVLTPSLFGDPQVSYPAVGCENLGGKVNLESCRFAFYSVSTFAGFDPLHSREWNQV